MKLTRFSVLFAAALALGACNRSQEEQPAIDETTPAPPPAAAPSPDTSMMHMDTTATSTTTGL